MKVAGPGPTAIELAPLLLLTYKLPLVMVIGPVYDEALPAKATDPWLLCKTPPTW